MPDTIIAKTKLDSDSVSRHWLEAGVLFASQSIFLSFHIIVLGQKQENTTQENRIPFGTILTWNSGQGFKEHTKILNCN